MKKINFFLFFLASMLATACLYESEVPFTYQKGAVSPHLPGSWEIPAPGDYYVKISNNNGDVRLAFHDKVTHAVAETTHGYCTRLGAIPLIIYKSVSDGETSYSFAKYSFAENNTVLKMTALDEDLFRENEKVRYFKTAGALREFMLKNIEAIRAYKDEDDEMSLSFVRKNSNTYTNWLKEQEKIAAAYPHNTDHSFSSEYEVKNNLTTCPPEFRGVWMHDSKVKRVEIGATRQLYEYSVGVSVLTQNADNGWKWNEYQPSTLKFIEVEGQKLACQKLGTRYYYFQYSRQNDKLAIRYVNAEYVKKYRPAYDFEDASDLNSFFERHINRPGFFTDVQFFTPNGKSTVLTLDEEKRKIWDTWYARYGYQDAPYDRSTGKYNPKVTFETEYESAAIGIGLWIGTVQWTTAKSETGECAMIYDSEGGMRIFSENAVAQRLAQQEASGQRPTPQTYSQTNNSKQSDSDNEELKSRAMLGLLGMLIVGGLILGATSNESSYQAPSTPHYEVVGYDMYGMPITDGPTTRTIYYDTDGKRVKWD